MNNIIPASRLGELLAAKTGEDVDACTKFVKEYFGLIEATLSVGENVTIKDIGTFKLTGDESNPVVYVVDSNLAATVNAPFEAFSAVELSDSEFNDSPATEQVSEPVPEPDKEPEPAPVKEPEPEPTPVQEPEVKPEPEPTPEPKSEPKSEPNPIVVPIAEIITEPEPTPEPTPEPQPIQEPEPQPISEPEPEPEPEVEPEPTYAERATRHRHHSSRSRRSSNFPKGLFIFWVVIFFVLGILLGLAAGYFGYRQINQYITGAPIPIEASYDTDDEAETDTDTIASADAIVSDTQTETASATETANEKATAEAEKTVKQAPRYDTITETCFLTTLARKYYGQMDFWVFIYDANDLGNPNRIHPGTKVRIPYPEELKLTGNTDSDVKAAKQRASAIYAKFK